MASESRTEEQPAESISAFQLLDKRSKYKSQLQNRPHLFLGSTWLDSIGSKAYDDVLDSNQVINSLSR